MVELFQFLFAIIAVVVGIFLMIWFVLLPYNMAKDRGRSGGLWLLFGLLANPLIAIILLALLGDAESER